MDFKEKYAFDPNCIYYLQLPNSQKRRLDYEELEKLMINPKNNLPEMIGQKTWISNYILTFWTPIMKPGPFALYMQLVKMAYGNKHYAFPSSSYLAMLLGVSERSVKEYARHLTDLGFLNVVERFDAVTNKQLSNLYFLTSTTPILPKKYYEKLPKKLQQEHDRFMELIQFKHIFREEE